MQIDDWLHGGYACDAGTTIGQHQRSCAWSRCDQYVHMKRELNQCNHFGLIHGLTASTEKYVEDISISF